MHSTSQRLLIIGYVWPEPGSSAAGRRMMQLISQFRIEGWEITLASPAAETDHMADLDNLGIQKAEIEINCDSFDVFIRELQPDMVLFDRFMTEEQFGWRVAEQCPGTLRILDTEDLHFLRRARRKAVSEHRSMSEQDLLLEETAKREIASILRSDLSLIISEYEVSLLVDLFGLDDSLLHYLPFIFDPVTEGDIEEWPAFESREHFVSIGNFRHEPNRDAVRHLKEDIWPLIRKELPESEMYIYGSYPTSKTKQLHKPEEGFYIKGRVKDAKRAVRRARVCLAPLRFGAGLKGKLVEAMQCGTPSVTTRIGAEGIGGEFEWPGAIASGATEFASAAVNLYTSRRKWEQARYNGIQIINNRFSKKEHGAGLVQRIHNLQDQLKEHRTRNFTGRMLMHHTTASTRFMAKWIEEKNRS